jgi:hypothetical protein
MAGPPVVLDAGHPHILAVSTLLGERRDGLVYAHTVVDEVEDVARHVFHSQPSTPWACSGGQHHGAVAAAALFVDVRVAEVFVTCAVCHGPPQRLGSLPVHLIPMGLPSQVCPPASWCCADAKAAERVFNRFAARYVRAGKGRYRCRNVGRSSQRGRLGRDGGGRRGRGAGAYA